MTGAGDFGDVIVRVLPADRPFSAMELGAFFVGDVTPLILLVVARKEVARAFYLVVAGRTFLVDMALDGE